MIAKEKNTKRIRIVRRLEKIIEDELSRLGLKLKDVNALQIGEMQMCKRFKVKPIVLAMLPLLAAGGAFAQQDEKADDVEVIKVTGYRGSIQKAINEKRTSKNIVDSIHAEDVGKTTDQNIADALSRVTGISIQTEDGEGTKITVRGTDPNLNNISLNGISLTSGGENQAVDLSAYSADILSQMTVYKTSSADQDEGSLGANVVLRTGKPLSFKDDVRKLTVQGRYDDLSDEFDQKLSGAFSEKFFDDRLGLMMTAAYETQSVRKDQVSGAWDNPFRPLHVEKRYNYDGQGTKEENRLEELPIAKDTEGNLVYGGQSFFYQRALNYSLMRNQRDRATISGAIQFQPSDDTDIQLDLSYSKQIVERDDHKIGVNAPAFWAGETEDNHTVGSELASYKDEDGNPFYHPEVADPQEDWWVVDMETRTVVKALNRYGSGNLNRQQDKNETVNKVATLSINHIITDDLVVDFKAGYSSSDYEIIYNENVSTGNWLTAPNEVKREIPLDVLNPVGYDCTTGKCQIVVGAEDSTYTYMFDGTNDNANNRVETGFNPMDPNSHHLSWFSLADGYTKDTNASVYLDFDWDTDLLESVGVYQIEFGGKASRREKDTYRFDTFFQGDSISAFDPVTGEPVKGKRVSSIKTSEVLDNEEWDVDGWMDGLVGSNPNYPSEFMEDGWGLINTQKALYNLFALDGASQNFNDSGSRRIVTETQSFYGKLNFEYFDGTLSGDIGVRYVKDERESFGTNSLKYYRVDDVFTPHEMVANGLWDTNQRECTPHDNTYRTTKLDGTGVVPEGGAFNGYDENGNAKTYYEGESIPNQYPCFDPWVANGYVSGQPTGDFMAPDEPAPNGRGWWQVIRHADSSTVDYSQQEGGTDRSRRNIPASASFKQSMWLPSLNLNYQVGEDMIVRFAASQTMARPPIDQTRPNFTYTESLWADWSTGKVFNPELKSLTSNNLDLSWEWYFNQTGQLSIAVFSKDIEDFTDEVSDRFYYKDLRREEDLSSLSGLDFLIPLPTDGTDYKAGEDISYNGNTSACHPDRVIAYKLKQELPFGCDEIDVKIVRNGASQTSRGVEFTYRQTYDFLPSPFDGTGVNFNYTLSKSEFEKEQLEVSGSELGGTPMAYTPEHTVNTALYWQKWGHSMKLTHRYTSEQVAQRKMSSGILWLDTKSTVDFSANYKVNEHVSFSLNLLNLTDAEHRTFWTSTESDLGDETLYDEGLVTDGEGTKSRTVTNYKTGRRARIGVRVNF